MFLVRGLFAAASVGVVGVVATREWDANWDMMEEYKGNATDHRHHIFLIRHGQYIANHPDLRPALGGEEDFLANDHLRGLTELGKEQAAITGERVAKILSHEGLLKDGGCGVRVYASDMARAAETAEIIHRSIVQETEKLSEKAAIPLLKDSLLREGAPCMPEAYNGPWKPAPFEFHQEGSRIESAFRKFFHRPCVDDSGLKRAGVVVGNGVHTVDVVVCHGNVIRYCLMRSLQVPPSAWLHFALYNASITRLSIRHDGNVSITNVGDTGALPVDKITYG